MTKILTTSVRITGNGPEEDVDSNIMLEGWATVVWYTVSVFAYPALVLLSVYVV